MLERLLYADWNDPPESMDFELPLGRLIEDLRARLGRIQPQMASALARPAEMHWDFWQDCLDLYLRAPALVNVALNHKVCVEQGLPLHPTTYFEVSEKTRFQAAYPPEEVAQAQVHFLESIATARAVFTLGPEALPALDRFEATLRPDLRDFIYTSTRDKYTWRASDPRKILSLAQDVKQKLQPLAIVGAAHGSIMSGLLFANILQAPLYFIRFSMFKRKDTAPVISPSDLQALAQYRQGPVLLFDEDVAKGTTLTAFTDFLRPFFSESYSAGVLRHRFAAHRTDFTGEVWSD